MMSHKCKNENRPRLPSGLSHRSNSSRVAAEDPSLNPAWGRLYGKNYQVYKLVIPTLIASSVY